MALREHAEGLYKLIVQLVESSGVEQLGAFGGKLFPESGFWLGENEQRRDGEGI